MLPSFRRQRLGGNRCVDFTGGALQSPGGVYSSSALTVCMWLQQTSSPADYALSVLTTFGTSYTGLAAAFGNDLAVWGNGSTFGVLFGSINLNQWYWAAFIADGVNTRAIGTLPSGLLGQVSSGVTSGNAADVLVVGGDSNGASATASGNWPGVIAGYKAWSSVMTNEELLLERTQLAPVSQRHLVDYLPLRNAGGVATDEVRNAPAFWAPQTAATFKSQNIAPPVPEIRRKKAMSFLSRPSPANTTFLGVFDPTAVAVGWFDPTTQGMGWFAQELLQPLPVPFFDDGSFPAYIPQQSRSIIALPAFVPVVVTATTPTQAPSIFPDTVSSPRRIDPLVEHAALVQLVVAATTPTQFPSVFPDSVPRAKPAQQAGQASIVVQEQTVAIAAVDFASIVRRPFFAPSEQLAVTELSPAPERTSSLAAVIYVDSVVRPFYATREQPFITGISPAPERTLPATDVRFPDQIVRPLFHADQQQAVTELSPRPERTAPLADVEFPERVLRIFLHADGQLAVSELPPAPERAAPLADVTYPDRTIRPAFLTALQLASSEETPSPERPAPIASTTFADAVLRPFYAVREQPFITGLYPTPERSTALADTEYPDRVPRPWVLASSQEAVLSVLPSPERTSPLVIMVYPDRVDRPGELAAAQLFTTELSPTPERALSLGDAIFPDRATRRFFDTKHQPSVADIPVRPEEKIQLDWGPNFPEAIAHRLYPTAAQLDLGYTAQSIVVAVPVQAPTQFPAWIDRRVMLVSAQLAATELPPRPERTTPLADVSFPERVIRPVLPASAQLAASEVPPRPERTSPIVDPLYPSLIPRWFMPTGQQLAVTEVQPRPEQKIANDWSPWMPDRVPRSLEQAALFAFNATQLFVLTPIYFGATYPDVLARQSYLKLLAHSVVPPRPEEKVQLDWGPDFPETARRVFMAADVQPFFTTSPRPERTFVFSDAVGPEHVFRPGTRPAEQLSQPAFPPAPEAKVQLDWEAFYADRVLRIVMHTSEQLAFAQAPIGTAGDTFPHWEPFFPERVVRDFVGIECDQTLGFYPQLPPPVPTQFPVDMPAYIERLLLHPFDQLFITELSPVPHPFIPPIPPKPSEILVIPGPLTVRLVTSKSSVSLSMHPLVSTPNETPTATPLPNLRITRKPK